MEQGLYEQLINKLIATKIQELSVSEFFIKETLLNKAEASRILSQYLNEVIRSALNMLDGEGSIERQIKLSNKIIRLLQTELNDLTLDENLIENEAKILSAIFRRLDSPILDFEKHIKEITPYTRLVHSELFTGSNAGISLESEIKKEILSADKVCFLVSFVRWSGIRIFEKQLEAFTNRGGQLNVITTSYMGATEAKAIEYLAKLPNTKLKISYNTQHERLHAKAYLFFRKTGFHTGYIGSSNISRSALTNGLEWNIKITTKEVSHIIDKFQKTFDTYWEDKDFEFYDSIRDLTRLKTALKYEKENSSIGPSVFFDIEPRPFQKEILEKLITERQVHNRNRNLIVAATGTGKTIISAFDFKQFLESNPKANLLFVAHRKEILTQAIATYRGVLRDNNLGELWVDGTEPKSYNRLFASVQTLNSQLASLPVSETFYDFIVIDEVHHIAAKSYRPILERFTSNVLLGLTATPERMDGADILQDFCGVVAAEIRLPEALNSKLLCPFQYFGITDGIDLSGVSWQNGKYAPGELSKIYTQNDIRVRDIIRNLDKYLTDPHDVRALGFCVTQDHAMYMAEKFVLAGFTAAYLTSDNSFDRDSIRNSLIDKHINYLFVVDIYNEGVDIPEVDTVLFLRPTESLTVFLQQLGRGLRLADHKECLTVLDFVSNSRPEYDFERKFRALVGKTATPIRKEIEDDFPHLPLGCSIVLEKVAKEIILNNIKDAIDFSKAKILSKMRNYRNDTTLPFNLHNFIVINHIPLQMLYRRGGWKQLCFEAGILKEYTETNEVEIIRAISKKWLSTRSYSYFSFIISLAQAQFKIDFARLSSAEKAFCLMLHYDIWQSKGNFSSLEESIDAIGRNPILVNEIIEVLSVLANQIDFLEYDIQVPFPLPLKIHGRYTRDQILAAFEFSSFDQKSSNREGVAFSKKYNTELLMITLDKSDADFSPTTLYEDYAISDTLFHWQSQNATSPESEKGQSYIHHEKQGKQILLFVRERNDDEYGNTMGSVFLGRGRYIEHYGTKPMSITWELETPMPAFLWKDAAKMAVG